MMRAFLQARHRTANRPSRRAEEGGFTIRAASWLLAQTEQHDVRAFLGSFYDGFLPVGRYVEIGDREIGADVRQRSLVFRLEVQEPEILMADRATQQDERAAPTEECQMPGAPRQRERR